MAMEAEELEFGPSQEAGPRLRLVGVGDDVDTDLPARRRGWWIVGGLAAAAGIALASALPLMMRPTVVNSPTIVKHDGPAVTVDVANANEAPKFRRHQPLDGFEGGGTTPVWELAQYEMSRQPSMCMAPNAGLFVRSDERADPGMVQQCVVMSICRDDHGAMQVRVKPQQWAGNKCLSDVTPQEIRTVGIGQTCSPAAYRSLVVAMSGPQRALPKTEMEAEGVAQCILGVGHHGTTDNVSLYADAAMGCVSPEVAVKVEAVAGR
jgi:hypothetical protein